MSSHVKLKRDERFGMSYSISDQDLSLWCLTFLMNSKFIEVVILRDLHGLSLKKLEKVFISGTVDGMSQVKTGCVKEL